MAAFRLCSDKRGTAIAASRVTCLRRAPEAVKDNEAALH